MKQGDNVLIWGASGGLGGFATQYALNGGATPVCVVSNEEKAEICRSMGAELIINRSEEDYKFWKDEHTQDPREWKRFGAKIRELTGGEDIDIVFEHPGRETFGASVYVTRKGGTITTCASTSGYMHEYDNRYLWMNLKRIISLPLRQLPRVVGGQPPHRQGHDPPHPVADLRPRRGRPGRARRPPATPTRARSACSAWLPRRASACATRRCAPSTSTRSTASAASEPPPRPPARPTDCPNQSSEPGWAVRRPIGDTGVRGTSQSGRGSTTMSDQGLSIFDDDETDESTDDTTDEGTPTPRRPR